jgi:secreted trypsin-like serine protease
MYQILLTLAFSSSVKSQMEGFIVGGEEVSIRVWPFIAFIEATLPNDQTSACGGSLLSSQTVLTAAHCLDDMTEKKSLK